MPSYFTADASVMHEGVTYTLTLAEQLACESPTDWHGPGDPSSWLSVAIFRAARDRVNGAPVEVARELAARALGITAQRLAGAIEWHVQYMRFHDGDYSYDV